MQRLRQIFTLIALVFLLASCQQNNTKISGTIGPEGELPLVFELFDLQNTTFLDSLRTGKDGSFRLRFHLEEPGMVLVSNDGGQVITLLVHPGEELELDAMYETMGSSYQVAGSPGSAEILELNEQLDQTRQRIDSIQVLAAAIEDTEGPEMDALKEVYARAIVDQKRFTITYLIGHMKDLSSIYALYQRFGGDILVLNTETDLQYFRTVADSLEASQGSIRLVEVLKEDILRREKEQRERAALDQMLELAGEESGVLDLEIKDLKGNEVTLSSLMGKPALLVFWASQNETSISALLSLKSTYDKYHPKGFEIYSVSVDVSREAWEDAVRFNEFDWINVCELSEDGSRAAMLYNVQALPTSFLLNKEGDILARDLWGRQLETWLDNLI